MDITTLEPIEATDPEPVVENKALAAFQAQSRTRLLSKNRRDVVEIFVSRDELAEDERKDTPNSPKVEHKRPMADSTTPKQISFDSSVASDDGSERNRQNSAGTRRRFFNTGSVVRNRPIVDTPPPLEPPPPAPSPPTPSQTPTSPRSTTLKKIRSEKSRTLVAVEVIRCNNLKISPKGSSLAFFLSFILIIWL
jgi:hypothetical protein